MSIRGHIASFSALVLLAGAPASGVLGQSGAVPSPRPAASPDPLTKLLTRQATIGTVVGDLQDLVAAAEGATAVKQVADARVASLPVVAYQFDLSLGVLHECIVRSHVLTWTPGDAPASFRLRETTRNKQSRADAAAAARLKGRRRIMARWEEVKRMAFLPERDLERLARGGDRTAKGLQHPRVSAAARLVYQLPASTLADLWSQGKVQVRVADLAQPLQALAVQVAPAARMRVDGESYLLRDTVRSNGSIELMITGTPDHPNVQGILECGRRGNHKSQFSLLYPEVGFRQPPAERRREIARPSGRSADPRLEKRVTLREPASRQGLDVGERPPRARPLAEFLKEAASQTRLPVIADCDYQPKNERWLKEQGWLAQDLVDLPLAKALDLLCADFEAEWFLVKGAIVVRSRYWYLPLKERATVKRKEASVGR